MCYCCLVGSVLCGFVICAWWVVGFLFGFSCVSFALVLCLVCLVSWVWWLPCWHVCFAVFGVVGVTGVVLLVDLGWVVDCYDCSVYFVCLLL